MAADPWIGRTLASRYALARKVDAGGMGSLYAARDLHTGADVAVKLLADAFADDPVARERFRREAVALRRLRHPHVVEYRDHGEGDGAWLVMELLAGESIAARLRRGAMPQADAIAAAAAVAHALDHAHAAGVLHRDVKPANVFVGPDGAVKLLDFGVARLLAEHTLTAANALVGTVLYMAPEQAAGEGATRASDLYALGVTLYEMVAGARPYGGSARDVVRAQRTREVPRLGAAVPGVDPMLDDVVHRLMQRDPRARPPSARALAEELSVVHALAGAANARAARALDAQGTVAQDPARFRLLHRLETLRGERNACAQRADALDAELRAERDRVVHLDVSIADVESKLRAYER